MMRLILTALSLCFISVCFGQALCGFDELHASRMKNAAFAESMRISEKQIQEYIANNPNPPQLNGFGTALYIIPVVVHVVHTGGEVGSIYNPGEAQILNTIDYLNKAFDGTALGFSGGAGDIQIQFRLAQRDPNCNPTTGIDRVDGTPLSGYANYGVRVNTIQGVTDIALKNQSRWDPARYYNIWVVSEIDNKDGTSGQFVAGYAQFAGGDPSADGAVVLATSFQANSKILPHEIGHALNLYHPFQGSSSVGVCPANTDCSVDGDRVCDTEPISYNTSGGVVNFSCRTGTNSCTGNQYNSYTESNVMNYTNCFTLFTPGQKARMIAAMSLPSRASLAASDAADPTDAGANPCLPKINFVTAKATVTEATVGTVDCRGYKDYTYNMTIGNIPTADATVTLTTSGLAISGSDYIITTNDNFSIPQKTLVFAAGSKAAKSFKVRIFDDAAVEDEETLIIDFVLDAHGGNAVKGDAIPKSTISIISTDNDFPDPSTGQTVETALNATGTAYFGPFDDVYFYAAGGTILVRLKNFTDFDYGCTQVKIDRAGAGAKAFTSNVSSEYVADKTVEVIPTFDKPNGSFEITLYYKLNEVQGWQSATGKTIFDAKLLKTPKAVSSYTAGTIPPGIVRITNPASGFYGSDYSINGTFNAGLKGGFALGAPSIPAPVIYTFTGNGLWTNPANWTNSTIPPAVLPAGNQIIINPAPDGQCILNINQTVQAGGSVIVNQNKQFVIQGNLEIVN